MTGAWATLRLVAGREVREALRAKTFWIIAALLLAGSTAAMVLPEVLAGDDEPRYEVAVVGDSASLRTLLDQTVTAIGGELELVTADDPADARRLVLDGDADVAVVAGDEARILVKAGEQDRLVGAVRQALAADALVSGLQDAGLEPAEIEALLSRPPAQVDELDPGREDRRGAAWVLSMAMYLLLLMLMMGVANGTAIEKSNRISEVLLAIVRPGHLLFGKVLGVGAVGFLNLACGAAPVLVKMAVGGDLPEGLGGALAGGAAWFVLGGALYLVLAGAAGALVDRQEEAGTVVAPLSLVLIVAYLASVGDPEGGLARVLAYVPLTSPMVMPSRLAVGAANPVEVVVSLALSLLAVLVAFRVAAVVYQRAIVRTGRRLKLREVL